MFFSYNITNKPSAGPFDDQITINLERDDLFHFYGAPLSNAATT
ncbi:MAG: hypothetical protein ABI045_04140 [Flavobacteriales bacterium]